MIKSRPLWTWSLTFLTEYSLACRDSRLAREYLVDKLRGVEEANLTVESKRERF